MTVSGTWGRRPRGWAAAAALLLALAGCGGGDTVEPFNPNRLLAFGDESSVLTSDGKRYGINALTTAGAIDCAADPIWVQRVARAFGLFFDQCRGSATGDATARILAVPGGKVGGSNPSLTLAAQIDAVAPTFTDKDLALVLTGANDVLELYARFPATGESALAQEARARGKVLGQLINRIVRDGPAVVVVTVPDLGLSPFALAEKAAHTDTDRAALISRLTEAFNAAMRLEIINDGRLIGIVLGMEEVRTMVESPGSFGIENVTQAACASTVTLPDCTTQTLVTQAAGRRWLWADGTRLGPYGHLRLGQLAESRALNNPF